MYVGDDEKLHFVDKDGADSVLPFSSIEYISLQNTLTGQHGITITEDGLYNIVIRDGYKQARMTLNGEQITVQSDIHPASGVYYSSTVMFLHSGDVISGVNTGSTVTPNIAVYLYK